MGALQLTAEAPEGPESAPDAQIRAQTRSACVGFREEVDQGPEPNCGTGREPADLVSSHSTLVAPAFVPIRVLGAKAFFRSSMQVWYCYQTAMVRAPCASLGTYVRLNPSPLPLWNLVYDEPNLSQLTPKSFSRSSVRFGFLQFRNCALVYPPMPPTARLALTT